MVSLWNDNIERPEFPTLEKDIKTDVLIIGGGIVGLLTAYFLQERGVPYVLAEKGRICGGTTGNTTAKITFQHGLVYDKILRSRGAEIAEIYLRANMAAFSPSRSIVRPQLFVNGAEAAKNLLTFGKKRCPHLGCALSWNPHEHSWDCDCHGSRFGENGEVLDNPANGDMKA